MPFTSAQQAAHRQSLSVRSTCMLCFTPITPEPGVSFCSNRCMYRFNCDPMFNTCAACAQAKPGSFCSDACEATYFDIPSCLGCGQLCDAGPHGLCRGCDEEQGLSEQPQSWQDLQDFDTDSERDSCGHLLTDRCTCWQQDELTVHVRVARIYTIPTCDGWRCSNRIPTERLVAAYLRHRARPHLRPEQVRYCSDACEEADLPF